MNWMLFVEALCAAGGNAILLWIVIQETKRN